MILTDEEVEQRLTSPQNLLNKVQIVRATQKKNVGDTAVPTEVKGLLARLSIDGAESDSIIAKVFGVSQPTVSNAARGLVGDRLDDELAETVGNVKAAIKEKTENAHNAALDSLVISLGKAKPLLESGIGLSVQDLTRTAKDMSIVVANLKKSGVEDVGTTNNTVVILHPPERRNEKAYEVLDV